MADAVWRQARGGRGAHAQDKPPRGGREQRAAAAAAAQTKRDLERQLAFQAEYEAQRYFAYADREIALERSPACCWRGWPPRPPRSPSLISTWREPEDDLDDFYDS